VQVQKNKCEALIAGVKPMLNCIDFESSEAMALQLGDRPPRPDVIIDRCKGP
jgi:hypothetical protein